MNLTNTKEILKNVNSFNELAGDSNDITEIQSWQKEKPSVEEIKESFNDKEQLVNTAILENDSSDDESIIGYDSSFQETVKRQKINHSIWENYQSIHHDSYDDDEFIFSVKLEQLVNPEYVEYKKSDRLKLLKPILKKREYKDTIKELENDEHI